MQPIPFLDLITPHRELREELVAVFNAALDTAGFIGGPMVQNFEREFAAFCETEYCVGVGSGTDAVRFALMAAGVKPGSIAVTVPNTFIATTEAITQAGARPDFVDIDERTYNMSPEKLREYLEEKCYVDETTGELINRKLGLPVTAIVPVHLYGQPVDMDPILALADRFHLIVVEDACQAHGAEYYSAKRGLHPIPASGIGGCTLFAPGTSRDCEGAVSPLPPEGRWRKCGSMGHAGAFSFYPGKNLGACGEAGAVTTNDPEIAARIRMIRDHGQAKKYYHDVEGYNGRLDAIQAGILSVKLKRLPQWNAGRREAAARYREFFAEAGIPELAPFEPEWARAVYHLYVIRVQDREGFMRHLGEQKIGTGIHYPVPLHLQKAYQGLGYTAGAFPVTEKVASEIVSLPIFAQLTAEQQAHVLQHTAALVSRLQFA